MSAQGDRIVHMFETADSDEAELHDPAAYLIDAITGLDRLIARRQARQAIAIAAFAEERRRGDEELGLPTSEAGKYAAEEIALARRVSPTSADYYIAFALGLVQDHPATLAAMLDGKLPLSSARAIVKECEVLRPVARRAVDADIAVEAAQLTPGQVRQAVRRRVCDADAEAATRRAEAARLRKRIGFLAREETMASVYNVLPAEQAAACWSALDDHARGVRADGDERSIEHIMCDTFVERLTGQSKASEVPVEIGVVISASSLLGGSEEPAALGGYGALPPDVVRRLAESESAWARRLVCDPVAGHVVEASPRRRRFDGPLRRLMRASDQVCRLPVCDAPIRAGDHVQRYADGGLTVRENGQGLCERSNYCREHPGWSVQADPELASARVTWTTPTWHRYDSYPPPALGLGSLDGESLRRLSRRRRRRRRRRKQE